MSNEELLEKLTKFYLNQGMLKFSDVDLDAGYALMSPTDKQSIIKSVLTGTDDGHILIKNAIITSITAKAAQQAQTTITSGTVPLDQITYLL